MRNSKITKIYNPHLKEGEFPETQLFITNSSRTRIIEVCKWPDNTAAVYELTEQQCLKGAIFLSTVIDDEMMAEIDDWLFNTDEEF